MIATVMSPPELGLLFLQKEALVHQLHQAYRHYYAVLATQEAGDVLLIDQFEVQPLEVEFQHIEASLLAYVHRMEASAEGSDI